MLTVATGLFLPVGLFFPTGLIFPTALLFPSGMFLPTGLILGTGLFLPAELLSPCIAGGKRMLGISLLGKPETGVIQIFFQKARRFPKGC